MKVVILCGGQGIRAFPFTNYLPKPMLPLGGTPVLVHIIKNFVAQGKKDFILAAGYRRQVLDDYFEGKEIGAHIEIVDTGDSADTGSRIYNCRHLLTEPFIATYGDGLSDVPIYELVAFHNSHPGKLTISSVPMRSQYGVLTLKSDGKIDAFREKPMIDEMWINAGFMVMDPSIFDDWGGDNLESDVIPKLIEAGEAYSFAHRGFFKSFDFYKDVIEMEEEIEKGGPLPWQVNRLVDAAA